VTDMQSSLIMPEGIRTRLWTHLFPGDDDEHGAVIAAGIARSSRGLRLLARDLFLAEDGIDYVPGQRGYRMLRADFIREKARYCRDRGLAYLAIHNHRGTTTVAFSPDDTASHERGYPALLDISRGLPVGALVIAHQAVAGDIWLHRDRRVDLHETRVVGRSIERLYALPPPRPQGRGAAYERQSRLLGDRGLDLLAGAKVGVIGAGGMGSLIVELLARLGVGWMLVADPERIDITNLSRIVDSTRFDARTWLTEFDRPAWMRRLGARIAAKKVNIARRVARRANPGIRFEIIAGNFADRAVAQRFADCDYLFLAADSTQARLVFNALVHQYLIPGVQVGAKARVDEATGDVLDVFSVTRPVIPDCGCLWCNELISPAELQREAATTAERRAQNYLNEPDVVVPSVITLNASAASLATNDFLFAYTGLTMPDAAREYLRIRPRQRGIVADGPRQDPECTECGNADESRRGMGDAVQLPVRG
jgi:hypothetical protein